MRPRLDRAAIQSLKQVNDSSVSRLGLVWYAQLNSCCGVDATPLDRLTPEPVVQIHA